MCIWSEGRNGQLERIAERGELAPGVGSGFVFEHVNQPVLSGDGRVAFAAYLRDVSRPSDLGRAGLWAQRAGDFALQLVALEGQPAPGVVHGEVFKPLYYTLPAMNSAGQLAFLGAVGLPGSFDFKAGIWAQDVAGQLRLIALEGTAIDVDDGPDIDMRTIRSLEFFRSAFTQESGPGGLNDRGQVAFSAIFTDYSSGVFISDAVAVPEPAGYSPLLFTCAACAQRLLQLRQRKAVG